MPDNQDDAEVLHRTAGQCQSLKSEERVACDHNLNHFQIPSEKSVVQDDWMLGGLPEQDGRHQFDEQRQAIR